MASIHAHKLTEETFVKVLIEYLNDPVGYNSRYLLTLTGEYKRRVNRKLNDNMCKTTNCKPETNRTMTTKQVIPDTKSNVIQASEANAYRCYFYDNVNCTTGIAVRVGTLGNFSLQWSNGKTSNTFLSFSALVASVSENENIKIYQIVD